MLAGKTEEAEVARVELMGTSEVRAKISASHKGKIKSPTHRENLSKALTGKQKSAEHVAKMSSSMKGITAGWDKRSDQNKIAWNEKINVARKAKWELTSLEDRQEMSRKMNERQRELGSWKTGVEAARQARMGKKDSEELKIKKRNAQKAFWQTEKGKLLRKKISQTRRLNNRMKRILAPIATIWVSKT